MRKLLASLALVTSGCSFVFGGGPPSQHEQMPYFDCPSTYGLPVADAFIGASGVVTLVQALNMSEAEYAARNSGAKRGAVAGVAGTEAAIFLASAIYGAVQAHRCEEAKELLKMRILGRPPGSWSPAGPPPGAPAPVPPPPAAYPPPPVQVPPAPVQSPPGAP
jgi:hypothetical protein